MGCDFTEETCLEITWINSDNKTIISHYIIENLTKYKYFQGDSADLSDKVLELQNKFQPIPIVVDNRISYDMDLIRLGEFNLFDNFSVCEWVKMYLIDWLNKYKLLEEIIEGKYECKFKTKITGIKLVKRSCYLFKYYYYT